MELRDIQIFLTLAEELHFGRTAERLFISQARVSKAIKQQERVIGAALFERTSRRVALTPIGERLRDDLEVGYKRILDSLETASAAARGRTGKLVLGIIGPLHHEIAPVTDLFRTRYPDCELVLREIQFSDPFGPLRAGDVDMAMVWLPVREPDLTVGPVMMTEPLVITAAIHHPLVARGRVCLEDLADHCVIQSSLPIPDYWEEAIQPRTTPSGRPIPRGPSVATSEEAMAAVATGEALSGCGVWALKYRPRADLAYLPIEDGPTLEWALIWRSDTDRPPVQAFVDIARDQEPVVLTYPCDRLASAPIYSPD